MRAYIIGHESGYGTSHVTDYAKLVHGNDKRVLASSKEELAEQVLRDLGITLTECCEDTPEWDRCHRCRLDADGESQDKSKGARL